MSLLVRQVGRSTPCRVTEAAGVTGLVVGQPFDVVKVRYQTPSYNARYSSTFGALGAILREEGVSLAVSRRALRAALIPR